MRHVQDSIEPYQQSFHSEDWLFDKNVIFEGVNLKTTHEDSLKDCMDNCNVNAACIVFSWETRDSGGDCVLKSTITEKVKNNKYISARKIKDKRSDHKANIDDGNLLIHNGMTI